MTEFATKLSEQLNSIKTLFTDYIEEQRTALETNVTSMQKAYDNIKVIKADMTEAGEVLTDFIGDVTDSNSDINDITDDATQIIDNMYDMYEDGYITDPDIDDEDDISDIDDDDEEDDIENTDVETTTNVG